MNGPESITRTRLLLVISVVTIAAAVWGVTGLQRSTAERAFGQYRTSELMLTAMLDQETSFRGYSITRTESFLEPYDRGRRTFDGAVAVARRTFEGDELRALDDTVAAARAWQDLAETAVVDLRAARPGVLALERTTSRKRAFGRFRARNGRLRARIDAQRASALERAGLIAVVVILALGTGFAVIGYFTIDRRAQRDDARRRRERRYREAQVEFGEVMQIMRDEGEAHALVKHHLEREIPGSEVVVMSRNASEDRLLASTTADGEIADRLASGVTPDSCLAVRLGRPYRQGAGAFPLLACELCGKAGAEVDCVPSLVSGEVIGSVLLRKPAGIAEHEHTRITDSVTQVAPVLANLRNLAIAETRAATDALTGLPNSRACRDTLKRMVAHSGRALSPLACVMLDLDRFKQVNDSFGHGPGDDLLAAVGEVIGSTLRTSDFAGRYGGEEFLVLLPDTDLEGGEGAAEKLRAAIEAIKVPSVDRAISASLGVAVHPTHALDGETLVRAADRALYVAKDAGRNRVESINGGEPAQRDPLER